MEGSTQIQTDETVEYPPGLRLYGEEKERRQLRIVEYVKGFIPPGRDRLQPGQTAEVYERASRRFGLTKWGVIDVVPSELKPTNLESLAYARGRKQPKASPETPPPSAEVEMSPKAPVKRQTGMEQQVREAAREYLDPETGRVPAARASEIYETLAERFGRTKGTVANYLSGLGPTAKECAAYRWQVHADKRRPAVEGTPVAEPARPEPEPDYNSHPAALFPGGRRPDTPQKQRALRRLPRAAEELVDATGRLTDYDEQTPEIPRVALDPASAGFLQEFKAAQVSEFVEVMRGLTRALSSFPITIHRELETAVATVQGARGELTGWLAANGLTTTQELGELKDYVAELEAENARLTEKLRRTSALMEQAIAEL